MPAISDREIIEKFSVEAEREEAFNLLMKKYQERLYWHCRRLVISHDNADDALQNTLVKVWKNLGNFRAESGLYTWLFRIATNESLTLLKTIRKFQSGHEEPNHENWLADNLIADPYFDGDDITIKLQKAIQQLPEKQRAVFNLKYYEEVKYEDMSEMLDTSVGALKASYHHAVKKIEKYLKDE